MQTYCVDYVTRNQLEAAKHTLYDCETLDPKKQVPLGQSQAQAVPIAYRIHLIKNKVYGLKQNNLRQG